MSEPPKLLNMGEFSGDDTASRWNNYVEAVYQIYLKTVAFGKLMFRGLPVNCQFRPETHGKHYAFWHMMQEAALGKAEEDRTIDFERCSRVGWISWAIQNAGKEPGIRVFKQSPRGNETSWVLWLHEYNYAVILWERRGYFLLRTAFIVKPHKAMEFERDWRAFQVQKG